MDGVGQLVSEYKVLDSEYIVAQMGGGPRQCRDKRSREGIGSSKRANLGRLLHCCTNISCENVKGAGRNGHISFVSVSIEPVEVIEDNVLGCKSSFIKL